MNYISIKEVAKKWMISERRVRVLCGEDRVEGAVKVGRNWIIPKNATKPIDSRNTPTIHFDGVFNVEFPEIESLNSRLNALRPFSNTQLKMIKEDLNLRWTYNSNAIEGNTLTLKETKVALEGITIGGKTITEHLEVINHKEAIDYFEDVSVSESPLTERVIKDIHYLILKEIDSSNAGVYRTENVIISGAEQRPPLHIEVPVMMAQLVHNFNNQYKELHPIVKAALLHGEFVKIHPFVDGNGRTARILLNFSLMKDGLIPIVFTKKLRLSYYEALDKAHTALDYTDFIRLISDLLKDEYNLRLSILR